MEAIELRLYITGRSARSDRAVSNLHQMCRELLGDNCTIEIIDVMEDPDRAETDRILTTPTLLKTRPEPRRRVTGDLSELRQVVIALSLEPLQAEGS